MLRGRKLEALPVISTASCISANSSAPAASETSTMGSNLKNMVLLDVDGEQIGRLPASFQIKPGAISMVV